MLFQMKGVLTQSEKNLWWVASDGMSANEMENEKMKKSERNKTKGKQWEIKKWRVNNNIAW